LQSDINKVAQNIVTVTNKAAAGVAQRTDNNWDQSLKSINNVDIVSKIQETLTKSITSPSPVETFNQYIIPQLNSVKQVAKTTADIVTKKATAVQTQNNASIASTIGDIQRLTSTGLQLAKTKESAEDIKKVSDLGINTLLNITQAANKTVNQDHQAILSNLVDIMKNNAKYALTNQQKASMPNTIMEFKSAVPKATVITLPTITAKTQASDLARNIYSQVYKDKVSTEIMVNRLGKIQEALKPATNPNGTINTSKLQDSVNKISKMNEPILHIQQVSGSKTPMDIVNSITGGKSVSQILQESEGSEPTSLDKPSTSDRANNQGSPTVSAGIKPSSGSDGERSNTKSTPSGITIDPNKSYVTKSGNIVRGDKLSTADKAAVQREATAAEIKSVPAASSAAVVSVFGKAPLQGYTAVKGSVDGRIVQVDTQMYNQLKATGYKDNQIADSLASGKMGITTNASGKIVIGQRSDPNVVMGDSGLFKAEPFKTIANPAGGAPIEVPEWSARKLGYLGKSDAEIAKLGQNIVNEVNTESIGSTPVESGGMLNSIITNAKSTLINPDTRAERSGLFVLTPDTLVDPGLTDPVGHAEYLAKKAWLDTGVMPASLSKGYKVEKTVQGTLKFNELANKLASKGSSIDDVPIIGELNSYEVLKNVLQYATSDNVKKIAESNPRIILGAATDKAVQPVLENKLGSVLYQTTIDKAMTPAEKDYVDRLTTSADSKRDLSTALTFLPTSDITGSEDLKPYLNKQMEATALSFGAPVTPGSNSFLQSINAILFLPMVAGHVFGLVGGASDALRIAKAADGSVDVYEGSTLLGKAGLAVDNPSKLRVAASDGRIIDITMGSDGKLIGTAVKDKNVVSKSMEFKSAGTAKSASSDVTKLFNESEAGTKTGFFDDTVKPAAYVDSAFKPFSVVDKAGIKYDIKGVTKTGLMETSDSRFLVDYDGKGNYMLVPEDYVPAKQVVLSTDENGAASIVKISREKTAAMTGKTPETAIPVDTYRITYADESGNVKDIVTTRTIRSDDDAIQVASEYEARSSAARAAEPSVMPDGESVMETPTLAQEEAMKAEADALDGTGPGADMGGDGGGSYGGSSDAGAAASTTDLSKPTYNQDWGTEIWSKDGGKTWMAKDPETGASMTTTEYEKLISDRTELRRAKYDSATNTYKRIAKDNSGKWVDQYQDSAGGWVTKEQLDAERAAIAANNPTYTYSVDSSLANARTRTNDSTKVVQYMDPVTGNWLDKDTYVKLVGSPDTPIWNPDGYYYFKKSDGTFEILNPYTNVRQSPEDYAAYIANRNAVTTSPTSLSTYQASSASSGYSTVPDLQSTYDASVAQVASRAGGVEGTASAWDTFTKTSDFDNVIKSDSDLQILVKAKNGDSLTEAEITRAQYLRSKMTAEGQAAFDAATGGQTSANLMSANDFENLITGNSDTVANMTDAEIKASGLPPEKEIVVHQTKADENIGNLFATDEYQNASAADKAVINDEIRYYAGESTNTPNLLNKFNAVKSNWTFKATEYWNKIVESLRSAKNLIAEMPTWWSESNADYSMAELILGQSKFSDVLLVPGRGPTAGSMEKAFAKALKDETMVTGENGWQAASFAYKKADGWIVKSPEGVLSFVKKNDIVFSADEAMKTASTPLNLYFWDKPTNVPVQFQVPADAAGSKIIAVSKADPMSVSEDIWKGLTEPGGLSSDMTGDFIKVDLMSPSGIVWSTVRDAKTANYYQIGKSVNVVTQDAIRIGELAGKDLQALNATDFRNFIESHVNEVKNISNEDLPHLTKYLDETRAKIIEDARISTPEMPEITTNVPEIASAAPADPETLSSLQQKVDDLKSKFQAVEDEYHANPADWNTDPVKQAQQRRVSELSDQLTEAETKLNSYKEATNTLSVDAVASDYQRAVEEMKLKSAERMAAEDDLSQLADQLKEASQRLNAAGSAKEKTPIKFEVDAIKAKITAATSKTKRLAQESYDAQRMQRAQGSRLVTGRSDINDLLNELDSLPVSDGRKAFEEVLAKDEALKDTIKNMSRSEAEDLAAKVSEKLGSDRSAAEKIMGFNYQGAANRIPDETLAKFTASDKELISKARTRQLNQSDYQQIERILDNSNAYSGVSVGADLGRMKINNVLDSSISDKGSELRKLLTDSDVKSALKDETFADEAFNKAYDIDPNVANQYQKAAQDAIVAEIKGDARYNTLNKSQKEFIDGFYAKRIYTEDDIRKLAEIRDILPRSKFSRFVRGSVLGLGGMAGKVITSPWKAAKYGFTAWATINGLMFTYFAAEEGFQSIIQMTGWNTPTDQYMKYLSEDGIPSLTKVSGLLEPFNWILDNIPGANIMFAGAAGFKWYMENAVPGIMADKITKGVNSGLWIPDASCKFGPGCWGTIRPESERPAYWAAHPETIAFMDGDLVRRIYDIQPDGSIGANNLIAQGLGITDPTLAKLVGMGHLVAAGNQGAKDTLTKEFPTTYDMLVKGGAIAEQAVKAYENARVAVGGTKPAAGALSPAAALTGLTPIQSASVSVAPTTTDALSKYATFGGSAPAGDAQAWRSVFIKPDGSLDAAKLKAAYPDMTAAQMQLLFPKEAINKMVSADLSNTQDPIELAKKLNEYKANGMVDSSARIEQFLPSDKAAAFSARQNNPMNFKVTASGNTISWVDDTGYPHQENIIQSGKVLNPLTGQYDINQKKQDESGAEYTLDTGKYAEYINSGGKDIAGFLAKPDSWTCTYNCSASGSKGGGSGGKSGGKSGSSYSKSTGQTGIFIDTAGQGAEVYENSEKIGDTDVIIESTAGIHTITIKKAGYKSYTIPVQVYEGSIARKSVTLYADSSTGTTQTSAQKFVTAIGGDNALTTDHIVYAYAIAMGNSTLATEAKSHATPVITGSWTFTPADVKNLIAIWEA